MTYQEALAYFDNKPSRMAKALGITPAAVSQWREEIPRLRQLELEKISNGVLKAEPVAGRKVVA